MEQRERESELTQAEVADWTAGLDEVQQRSGLRFARSEQRQHVRRNLDGLLTSMRPANQNTPVPVRNRRSRSS